MRSEISRTVRGRKRCRKRANDWGSLDYQRINQEGIKDGEKGSRALGVGRGCVSVRGSKSNGKAKKKLMEGMDQKQGGGNAA